MGKKAPKTTAVSKQEKKQKTTPDSLLDQVQASISKQLSNVQDLYAEFQKVSEGKITFNILKDKIAKQVENTGLKLISKQAIEIQNQLFNRQRDLFSKVNKIDEAYTEVKKTVETMRCLSEGEIAEILSKVQAKSRANKKEIENLNAFCERAKQLEHQ